MDLSLDTVPMGRTGLQVSEIAFGTWRFGRETSEGTLEIDRERAHELLDTYAAAGGRFIDTADVYGEGDSERWIGEWLADRDREEFVVASKIYWPTRPDDPNGDGLNRKPLRRQIDLILDRLDTNYLDVLREVAEAVGASEAQVAIAFQRHHPAITAPIVGARTTDQLAENLRAGTVDLSDEQFDRLADACPGPFDSLL